MPTRGSHTGLDAVRAPSDPPASHPTGTGAAAGYKVRRTLPLWVEVRRQATRRRTQLTLGFLVVLPFLLVAAFAVGADDGPRNPNAPALVDLATAGAANFTAFTMFVSTGFLLVVTVALFAGDTVASEASWSSLRYLLASPVPRGRLLFAKLAVALFYCVVALVLLPVVTYLAGGVFWGWAPFETPLGATLTPGEGILRLAIVTGYIGVSLLFVAALGFVLSVWTDAPLGAVGGAVLLVIVSNILDAVTALGDWRRLLPTHYQYAWTDALAPTISWEAMAYGAVWSCGYAIVLFALAWRHFLRKDITS